MDQEQKLHLSREPLFIQTFDGRLYKQQCPFCLHHEFSETEDGEKIYCIHCTRTMGIKATEYEREMCFSPPTPSSGTPTVPVNDEGEVITVH